MATLSEVLSSIRIEVSDRDGSLWQEDELIRAIEKSVALMSRLLPKKSMISGEIESAWIEGNYLDISSLLPVADRLGDAIQRVEYPANRTPPELVPVEVMGKYLWLKTNVSLKVGEDIRIIYQGTWTPPNYMQDADYPPHLDNVVIIGASGQALIFKAESYVQKAASTVESIMDALNDILALTLDAPDLTAPDKISLDFPTAPTSPTLDTLTPPSKPSLDSLSPPTPPTLNIELRQDEFETSYFDPPDAPSLDDTITPPDVPVDFSVPTAPDLDTISAPSPPSSPALDFTKIETALDEISTLMTSASGYLTTGENLINAGTRGDKVGETYGSYASINTQMAKSYTDEALGRLNQIDRELQKYASEVTAYGSEVNEYANILSATVSKYRGEIEAQSLWLNQYASDIQKYGQRLTQETQKISLYSEEVRGYLARVNEEGTKLTKYGEESRVYASEISEESLKVSLYDAEARAFSTQVGEQSAKISLFQQEVSAFQSAVARENIKASLYESEVRAFQSEVTELQNKVSVYSARVEALATYASQAAAQVDRYMELGRRFLTSGQSKINEMATMLGYKPELFKSMSSSEQRE